MNKLKASNNLVQFLAEKESFSATPYQKTYNGKLDPPTNGYGTTRYPNGKFVTLDDPPITKGQAIEYKRYDLADVENWLNRNIKWTPNQSQFDALCALLYNLGTGKNFNNCFDLKAAIISGDKQAIINNMLTITNGGIPGLVERRFQEVAMFVQDMI